VHPYCHLNILETLTRHHPEGVSLLFEPFSKIEYQPRIKNANHSTDNFIMMTRRNKQVFLQWEKH
jgi:hypothetical protein